MRSGVALALLAAGCAGNQVGASHARMAMECQELIDGQPSRESTTYEVYRGSLLKSSPSDRPILISSDRGAIFLSRTEDDQGPQDAYARHRLTGSRLTRVVYWQRPGKDREVASVEQFDFGNQTIRDLASGEDRCNHGAYGWRR